MGQSLSLWEQNNVTRDVHYDMVMTAQKEILGEHTPLPTRLHYMPFLDDIARFDVMIAWSMASCRIASRLQTVISRHF